VPVFGPTTDEAGNQQGSYYLPAGAVLQVEDKQQIKAGNTLAKMPKEAAKTNDITGGIPRVTELFEARKPKVPTVLAKISGTVKFKGITKAVSFNANIKVDTEQVSIYTEPTDIDRTEFGVKFQLPIKDGIIKNEFTLQVAIKAFNKK